MKKFSLFAILLGFNIALGACSDDDAAPVVKKLRLICVYMRKAEIPCMNLTVWSAVPGQISISKLPALTAG